MSIDLKVFSVLSIILASTGLFTLIHFLAPPAIASDRFVVHKDNTVTDNRTGLMWAAMDNGNPINWMDAHRFCRNYTAGDHTDWRMPTLAELASLYDPKEENKGGYHVNQSISTTASSCWASETRGNQAARFNFTYGTVYWLRRPYAGPTRVLPVRTAR